MSLMKVVVGIKAPEHLSTRTGVNPLYCPGQIATPQRCVLERSLGTQIGLGWGRQNERDCSDDGGSSY
jgi:hypothetical protein